MTTNIFHILSLSPQETCQDTEWVGLLDLKPSPPGDLPHQGSCPTCPRCFFTGFPHISHPSQAKSRGECRRQAGEPPGSALFCLAPGTWMWSRWDINTHPSLALSCWALLTLHLDISVYSFKNAFVLMSWESKSTDRNLFLEMFSPFLKRKEDGKENSAVSPIAEGKVIKKLRACVSLYNIFWGGTNQE